MSSTVHGALQGWATASVRDGVGARRSESAVARSGVDLLSSIVKSLPPDFRQRPLTRRHSNCRSARVFMIPTDSIGRTTFQCGSSRVSWRLIKRTRCSENPGNTRQTASWGVYLFSLRNLRTETHIKAVLTDPSLIFQSARTRLPDLFSRIKLHLRRFNYDSYGLYELTSA